MIMKISGATQQLSGLWKSTPRGISRVLIAVPGPPNSMIMVFRFHLICFGGSETLIKFACFANRFDN